MWDHCDYISDYDAQNPSNKDILMPKDTNYLTKEARDGIEFLKDSPGGPREIHEAAIWMQKLVDIVYRLGEVEKKMLACSTLKERRWLYDDARRRYLGSVKYISQQAYLYSSKMRPDQLLDGTQRLCQHIMNEEAEGLYLVILEQAADLRALLNSLRR